LSADQREPPVVPPEWFQRRQLHTTSFVGMQQAGLLDVGGRYCSTGICTTIRRRGIQKYTDMEKKKYSIPDGVRVGRSSAGLGLFATRAYKKGERIIEYFGRQISKEEEYSSRSKYLFEVNSRKTIDGTARENIARYINHSCKPNCEPEIVRGRIFIDAVKLIKPGDEFTYDYGEEYFDEHIKPHGCRCPVHKVLK